MDHYTPLVWHAVRAHMPGASRQDQEEVVADTFVRLLANRAELLARYHRATGLSPESYIRRQAIFQVRNRRRALNRPARRLEVPLEQGVGGGEGDEGAGRPAGDEDRYEAPGPNPERSLVEAQDVLELVAALEARVPAEVLLTFHLLYEQGLTPKEAARTLGCSTDTIYLRRKRIVSVMRAVLSERRRAREECS